MLLFAIKYLLDAFTEMTTSMKDEISISKMSKACSFFPKQSLNSTMLLENILPDLYPVPSTDLYELSPCTLQTATLCFNNNHTHCELLFLKLKMSYSQVWAATALSSTPVQHKVNFSSHHPLAPLTLHAQENSHSAERHSLNSFIANLAVAWSSK